MNDCVNAEFRDQLPALLHQRLEAGEREALEAHVAACADCREELDLLRALQGMFAEATPRVNTSSIVSALPPAPMPAGVLPFRRRAVHRMGWQVAAAVGLVAVGGSSWALARRAPSAAQAVATAQSSALPQTAPQARTVAVAAPAAAKRVATSSPKAAASSSTSDAELSMAGRLDDLSAEQLQTLLGEIGDMPATPITDPEPVIVPVTLTSDGGPAGI